MTYYSYLVFLISLSGFSLIILFLLRILDFSSATTRQKIMILKGGLAIIGISPFIFILSRLFSLHTLDITLHSMFINKLPAYVLSTSFTEDTIDWSSYIFALYGMGIFVMLLRIILSYLSARNLLSKSIPAIIQKQPVFINEHIKSPLSFGLPKAKIYFPSNMEEKWTQREIQMSLVHENNHLQQHDPLWKLFSLFAQALLFFVPWSYSLHRRLELEMEIHCDERTCIKTNANINEYGNFLLAMTCMQPKNFIYTNITDSTLKRRLLAMKSNKIKRPLLTSICCAILLLMGSTTIAMTSGVSTKEAVYNITSKIYVDGELISSPTIIANANQKASILISDEMTNKNNQLSMSGHALKLELIARNIAMSNKNGAIGINYDIHYQNGTEKMHSNPQIIVNPNQESTISISNSGHNYEIRVVAKRQ